MTGHKNDLEAYAALVGAARFANKTVSTEPALPVETVTAKTVTEDRQSAAVTVSTGRAGSVEMVLLAKRAAPTRAA